VDVGGIGEGVSVNGTGIDVETGVRAGMQPLNKTISRTNTRDTDWTDFFMMFAPMF
jgi:hypothetical protein